MIPGGGGQPRMNSLWVLKEKKPPNMHVEIFFPFSCRNLPRPPNLPLSARAVRDPRLELGAAGLDAARLDGFRASPLAMGETRYFGPPRRLLLLLEED